MKFNERMSEELECRSEEELHIHSKHHGLEGFILKLEAIVAQQEEELQNEVQCNEYFMYI